MYGARAGEVWTDDGFTLALFQGWGVGSEVLLGQVQLNFSFRTKFIIFFRVARVKPRARFQQHGDASCQFFFPARQGAEWKFTPF